MKVRLVRPPQAETRRVANSFDTRPCRFKDSINVLLDECYGQSTDVEVVCHLVESVV